MTPNLTNPSLNTGTSQPNPPSLSPEVLAQLRQVSILTSLTDDELHCFEGTELLHFADKQVVIRQGETALFFYILLEGTLNLSQTSPNGSELMLYNLSDGATFGEVTLLANIPFGITIRAATPSRLLRLNEQQFWNLMNTCPDVRRAILGNMALRFQKYQTITLHQEKMASLGTLAAGLMHELNNPGTAALRAAGQLRNNLDRLHALTGKFSRINLTPQQKDCLYELQKHALSASAPIRMNSLEQADAEESLATWMESAEIPDAWKLAPTLVSVGIDAPELECARSEFDCSIFSDALNWLEALVSSQQLVGMIEESIGRVSSLVHAVKSYAYEGKGARKAININDSIHATLVILGHKLREKSIRLDKSFAPDLPLLETESSGLNQVWTNLLDNAIDAVPAGGLIEIRTWLQPNPDTTKPALLCISIADNGVGIPLDIQTHIFDPFFTTKDVGFGTGLGLGIVHRIVEQFGGRIHFTSAPGKTEFVVTLPNAPIKVQSAS